MTQMCTVMCRTVNCDLSADSAVCIIPTIVLHNSTRYSIIVTLFYRKNISSEIFQKISGNFPKKRKILLII